MLSDQTVRGTNFTCFHAGPMEGWPQFQLEPPDVPRPGLGGTIQIRRSTFSASSIGPTA
jgi:hypothetical protein